MSGIASVKERAGITNGHTPSSSGPPVRHEDWLTKYQSEIARALPRHMTPDRMARIALTELRRVPKLMECNPRSFFGAVVQASQLGLEPGGGLGHAYLVPYKQECQLIIGYRGMIDLARRSGQIVSLTARVVHASDDFNYSYGLNETLHHVPSTGGNPGQLVYVYAVAKLKDGGVQFEVMSKTEVDAIRKRSKSSSSGPWVTDYEAMAKKTVIRQLFKYLPVSVEMQRATALDEKAEADLPQHNDLLISGDVPPAAEEVVIDGEIVEGTATETNGDGFNLGDG